MAFGSHLHYGTTMLRLKQRQRAVLLTALPALANLGMAALVFGQAVGARPFSWALMVVGAVQWVVLVSVTIVLAGVDEP